MILFRFWLGKTWTDTDWGSVPSCQAANETEETEPNVTTLTWSNLRQFSSLTQCERRGQCSARCGSPAKISDSNPDCMTHPALQRCFYYRKWATLGPHHCFRVRFQSQKITRWINVLKKYKKSQCLPQKRLRLLVVQPKVSLYRTARWKQWDRRWSTLLLHWLIPV